MSFKAEHKSLPCVHIVGENLARKIKLNSHKSRESSSSCYLAFHSIFLSVKIKFSFPSDFAISTVRQFPVSCQVWRRESREEKKSEKLELKKRKNIFCQGSGLMSLRKIPRVIWLYGNVWKCVAHFFFLGSCRGNVNDLLIFISEKMFIHQR